MNTCEHKWVLGSMINQYRNTRQSPYITNIFYYCEKCLETKIKQEVGTPENCELFNIVANKI